jgi:hypothetical protein
VFTETATKGRQTLLRRRANHIADYEALHHIHFWKHESQPKYIYYFGQSKTFEEWYDNRKDDQGAIFKGLEEKTTFTRHVFKERDYDNDSILYNLYNHDYNTKMEIENMKNDDGNTKLEIENIKNDIVEYLNEKFKGQSYDEIEKIQKLKDIIKKLGD